MDQDKQSQANEPTRAPSSAERQPWRRPSVAQLNVTLDTRSGTSPGQTEDSQYFSNGL